MGEEQVTKAILRHLLAQGWQIVSFDFPQSGTGRMLHPNGGGSEKNRGAIIPDIVAVKNSDCLFFENKDRFYLPDYEKVSRLIHTHDYDQAIATLLAPYPAAQIFYGIGLPASRHTSRAQAASHLVDFVAGVEETGAVRLLCRRPGVPAF